MKLLLEAGVHFGHQTKRWNPKMKPFIFGERNGIYIINLEKTVECINKAAEFLRLVSSRGDYVLFVGTKKQAQEVVAAEAKRCGMFFVNQRWLGGTLTNFETIRKSAHRLKSLRERLTRTNGPALSKKEIAQINREIFRLEKNLIGIEDMDKIPQAVFVVDAKKEETAVKEAKKLSIPVIAVIDTNCDPEVIDYVIPGNDDAIRAIKLLTSLMTDSVVEGRKDFAEGKALEKARAEAKLEKKKPIPPPPEKYLHGSVVEEVFLGGEEDAGGKKRKKEKPVIKKKEGE